MKKGNLIVIEGSCDGIGKSTQYKLLRERLEKEGSEIVNHHFPSYGTYHGAPVEKYLNGEFGEISELSPYFITSLYANDRAIAWHSRLKKLYEEGKTILLDRYTTSSLMYQSALIGNKKEKEEFIKYVADFEYKKMQIQEPDLVIFLTAPFDLVTQIRNKRKNNDGIVNDIHEKNIEFMKKVYDNSISVAKYFSWDIIECSKDNEMRSIEDIHEDIYKLVKKKIK